jgi:TolB protein
MASDGSELERLTSAALADDEGPAFHPDGLRIVFQSNRDGASDIVVVSIEDGSEIVLSPGESHEVDPLWSPSGDRVLFLSNRQGSLWDVWVVEADGAGPRRLRANSDDRDAAHSWSPDGREIAFESRRAGNWDVYVADPDSLTVRAVTTDGANDGAAAWRPGG